MTSRMREHSTKSSTVTSDVKLNTRSLLRRLPMLVLAGSIIVIAIAWSCACWSSDAVRGHHTMTERDSSQDEWIRETPNNWPERPLGITRVVPRNKKAFTARTHMRIRIRQGMHFGLSVSGNVMSFSQADNDPSHAIDVILTGWPVYVLQRRGPDDTRPVGSSKLSQLYAHGIPVPEFKPLGLKAGRSLPLQPIWGPFLLSVLAMCVVLEAFCHAYKLPGKLRLKRRIRLNQCTACGYQMNDLEHCPECGTQRS